MDIKKISLGASRTGYITNNNRLYMMGDNSYNRSTIPEDLKGDNKVKDVVCNGYNTVVVDINNKLRIIGTYSYYVTESHLPEELKPGGTKNVKYIEGVGNALTVIDTNNKLYMIGSTSYSQLDIPTDIQGDNKVLFCNNYYNSTIAIDTNYKIHVWGRLYYYPESSIPFDKDTTNIIKCDINNTNMAAIDNNNRLWIWGSSNNIKNAIPTDIQGDNKVKDIKLGYDHAIAIGMDNKIYIWGWNSNVNSLDIPSEIENNIETKKIYITKTTQTNAATIINNNVYIWGYNDSKGTIPLTLLDNYYTKIKLENTTDHCHMSINTNNNTLYLSTNNYLYAINLTNYTIKWELYYSSVVPYSPVIGQDNLIYLNTSRDIYIIKDNNTSYEILYNYSNSNLLHDCIVGLNNNVYLKYSYYLYRFYKNNENNYEYERITISNSKTNNSHFIIDNLNGNEEILFSSTSDRFQGINLNLNKLIINDNSYNDTYNWIKNGNIIYKVYNNRLYKYEIYNNNLNLLWSYYMNDGYNDMILDQDDNLYISTNNNIYKFNYNFDSTIDTPIMFDKDSNENYNNGMLLIDQNNDLYNVTYNRIIKINIDNGIKETVVKKESNNLNSLLISPNGNYIYFVDESEVDNCYYFYVFNKNSGQIIESDYPKKLYNYANNPNKLLFNVIFNNNQENYYIYNDENYIDIPFEIYSKNNITSYLYKIIDRTSWVNTLDNNTIRINKSDLLLGKNIVQLKLIDDQVNESHIDEINVHYIQERHVNINEEIYEEGTFSSTINIEYEIKDIIGKKQNTIITGKLDTINESNINFKQIRFNITSGTFLICNNSNIDFYNCLFDINDVYFLIDSKNSNINFYNCIFLSNNTNRIRYEIVMDETNNTNVNFYDCTFNDEILFYSDNPNYSENRIIANIYNSLFNIDYTINDRYNNRLNFINCYNNQSFNIDKNNYYKISIFDVKNKGYDNGDISINGGLYNWTELVNLYKITNIDNYLINEDNITLEWDIVQSTYAQYKTYYKYNDNDWILISNLSRSHTLNSLTENQTYKFKVKCVTMDNELINQIDWIFYYTTNINNEYITDVKITDSYYNNTFASCIYIKTIDSFYLINTRTDHLINIHENLINYISDSSDIKDISIYYDDDSNYTLYVFIILNDKILYFINDSEKFNIYYFDDFTIFNNIKKVSNYKNYLGVLTEDNKLYGINISSNITNDSDWDYCSNNCMDFEWINVSNMYILTTNNELYSLGYSKSTYTNHIPEEYRNNIKRFKLNNNVIIFETLNNDIIYINFSSTTTTLHIQSRINELNLNGCINFEFKDNLVFIIDMNAKVHCIDYGSHIIIPELENEFVINIKFGTAYSSDPMSYETIDDIKYYKLRSTTFIIYQTIDRKYHFLSNNYLFLQRLPNELLGIETNTNEVYKIFIKDNDYLIIDKNYRIWSNLDKNFPKFIPIKTKDINALDNLQHWIDLDNNLIDNVYNYYDDPILDIQKIEGYVVNNMNYMNQIILNDNNRIELLGHLLFDTFTTNIDFNIENTIIKDFKIYNNNTTHVIDSTDMLRYFVVGSSNTYLTYNNREPIQINNISKLCNIPEMVIDNNNILINSVRNNYWYWDPILKNSRKYYIVKTNNNTDKLYIQFSLNTSTDEKVYYYLYDKDKNLIHSDYTTSMGTHYTYKEVIPNTIYYISLYNTGDYRTIQFKTESILINGTRENLNVYKLTSLDDKIFNENNLMITLDNAKYAYYNDDTYYIINMSNELELYGKIIDISIIPENLQINIDQIFIDNINNIIIKDLNDICYMNSNNSPYHFLKNYNYETEIDINGIIYEYNKIIYHNNNFENLKSGYIELYNNDLYYYDNEESKMYTFNIKDDLVGNIDILGNKYNTRLNMYYDYSNKWSNSNIYYYNTDLNVRDDIKNYNYKKYNFIRLKLIYDNNDNTNLYQYYVDYHNCYINMYDSSSNKYKSYYFLYENNFYNCVIEGNSYTEFRLPDNTGNVNFYNCIFKGKVRFYPPASIQTVNFYNCIFTDAVYNGIELSTDYDGFNNYDCQLIPDLELDEEDYSILNNNFNGQGYNGEDIGINNGPYRWKDIIYLIKDTILDEPQIYQDNITFSWSVEASIYAVYKIQIKINDNDWTDYDENYYTFTNLKQGNYTFKVRAIKVDETLIHNEIEWEFYYGNPAELVSKKTLVKNNKIYLVEKKITEVGIIVYDYEFNYLYNTKTINLEDNGISTFDVTDILQYDDKILIYDKTRKVYIWYYDTEGGEIIRLLNNSSNSDFNDKYLWFNSNLYLYYYHNTDEVVKQYNYIMDTNMNSSILSLYNPDENININDYKINVIYFFNKNYETDNNYIVKYDLNNNGIFWTIDNPIDVDDLLFIKKINNNIFAIYKSKITDYYNVYKITDNNYSYDINNIGIQYNGDIKDITYNEEKQILFIVDNEDNIVIIYYPLGLILE